MSKITQKLDELIAACELQQAQIADVKDSLLELAELFEKWSNDES